MKKIFVSVFIVVSSCAFSFAQLAPHKYLIKFTDKNNSPYSVSNPAQFLSAKAIARRTTHGIAVKENDLPVNPAYVDSIANTAGVTLICRSKWFNSVTVFTTDSLALEKIKLFPFVSNVNTVSGKKQNKSKMAKVNKPGKFVPLNLSLKANAYVSNTFSGDNLKTNNLDYGMAANQVLMTGADYLHNLGYCGQGITIAVLDAGFWGVDTIEAFDSLWLNNQILGVKDFVEPGSDVFSKSSHGMMVLSIMGANLPGEMTGIAPRADYWLLRSEDASTENIIEEYNWASAAEFADSAGADIITSSLGYTRFDDTLVNHTYADMNGRTAPSSIAATIAAGKGILVCNSAGNSGQNDWHYIGAPADADSILSAGAVDDSGSYAPFSSTGPTADGRIKPDVATLGMGTVVISTQGNPVKGNGTSFSCPVLAGATACLWQAFPAMSNFEIMKAIKESASQYSNPDSLLGFGIPNFAAANMILSGVKIGDFDNENMVDVFPNPFSDIIYMLFFSTDTEYVDVEIFDITGKIVYSEPGIKRSFGYNYFSVSNIAHVVKGLYIMKIASGNNVYTKKIMKIE